MCFAEQGGDRDGIAGGFQMAGRLLGQFCEAVAGKVQLGVIGPVEAGIGIEDDHGARRGFEDGELADQMPIALQVLGHVQVGHQSATGSFGSERTNDAQKPAHLFR